MNNRTLGSSWIITSFLWLRASLPCILNELTTWLFSIQIMPCEWRVLQRPLFLYAVMGYLSHVWANSEDIIGCSSFSRDSFNYLALMDSTLEQTNWENEEKWLCARDPRLTFKVDKVWSLVNSISTSTCWQFTWNIIERVGQSVCLITSNWPIMGWS